ncbi:MAG TPA: signal recognition particle-docking protein FtsY [Casimicrobiaceae bacterium]|nr:signal recognition particle-docking protein FtsY [Casimicrobiaceae bacterium]
MFDFFKRKPDPPSETPLPQPDTPPSPVTEEARQSWSDRLRAGLSASRDKLSDALTGVFRHRILDEAALDDLELALLTADVGIDATRHLLEDLKERYAGSGRNADPRSMLRDALVELIKPLEKPLVIEGARPFVIMIAGVNGAGKTTSIGKLAKWLQQQGYTVLLSAGDTFRAAAREQLAIWGARNGVSVVTQEGGDAAAVTFDAVGAARARNVDVMLADTAGRLPTQLHLMEELKKVKRVVAKAEAAAPQEVLLVLDANTGQNALAQVTAFDAAIGLTGLIVTKLDGTAKGGIVAAIAKQHPVPIRFIGVGEGLDDLRPFVATEFVDALLPPE